MKLTEKKNENFVSYFSDAFLIFRMRKCTYAEPPSHSIASDLNYNLTNWCNLVYIISITGKGKCSFFVLFYKKFFRGAVLVESMIQFVIYKQ